MNDHSHARELGLIMASGKMVNTTPRCLHFYTMLRNIVLLIQRNLLRNSQTNCWKPSFEF